MSAESKAGLLLLISLVAIVVSNNADVLNGNGNGANGNGNGNGAEGDPEVIAEVMEITCSRCGGTRLVGCISGTCYYRCYRRCTNGNQTYHEAIKFTLPGT